jgi:DNA mismatch repair protein MutL
VSRLTITTRTPDAPEGTRVRVEGGAPPLVEPCGTAVGTRVEVRDLFYNVPARRKFQKSDRAEATAVEDMVTRLALANPHVDVELTLDGRQLLHAAPAADHVAQKDRAERILGKPARGNLYPVDGNVGGIHVHGFCANPAFSRGDQKGLHLFVNGRYVKDRTIQHAVVDGYRTLLEVGRNPVVVLRVDLDPTLVDVNVHPQKLEVRFADASNVHRAVAHVLLDMLRTTPWLRGPSRSYTLQAAPAGQAQDGPDLLELHHKRTRDALTRYPAGNAAPALAPPLRTFSTFSSGAGGAAPLQTLPGLGGALVFSRLKALGQVGLTYLICEAPDGMVVLDQHAAHERYNFERLRRQLDHGGVEVQQLLVPLRLPVTPAEEEAATRHAAALQIGRAHV